MPNPVLTVITVCFNAKTALQNTMTNLLEQTFSDYEYLVIDKDSEDGSKELLKEFQPRFSQANIPFRFFSGPDQGIYDAMNKGTSKANGSWLLFLNAGDLLASPSVLEQIFQTPTNAQIIYGDTICVYQGNQKRYPALPLENLCREMAFCHQSAFIKRELLLQHPYDCSYKICADHHFFLSMYLNLHKEIFAYRPIPISIYEIAGYSDKNQRLAHREQRRMQKELGVFQITPAWLLREGIFYGKQGIKSLLGQKFIDLVRKKKLHESSLL